MEVSVIKPSLAKELLYFVAALGLERVSYLTCPRHTALIPKCAAPKNEKAYLSFDTTSSSSATIASPSLLPIEQILLAREGR